MRKETWNDEEVSGTIKPAPTPEFATDSGLKRSLFNFSGGTTDLWLAAFNAVADAICILDTDLRIVKCNRAMENIAGVAEGGLIGQSCCDVFSGMKYPEDECPVKKMMHTLRRETANTQLGEDWVEITVDPLFTPEGEVWGAVQTIRTSAARRKNEEKSFCSRQSSHASGLSFPKNERDTRRVMAEALRKSEELLHLFLKYSPVYAYIKEVSPTQSLVIRASENFDEMIGVVGSQMEGKTMFELFSPEFAAKITADDWQVVSEGKVLVLDEELNGKSYTTIKFPILESGRTLLAGFTIDDTGRKRVEKELKRMNSLLTATLESTADGLLVVDRAGKISNYNQKFKELWQITDADILPLDDNFLISIVLGQLKDPGGFKKRIEELKAHEEESSFDSIEFADGRIYERYSQAQRLDGDVIGRVWSFRDITTRKQAEQTLKENETRLKELNATKDRIFSIVAHDLRTPFNSIVGFSSLLSDQVAEKDYSGIERYAQIIQDSSDKAIELLQNILEWSRSQTGRLSFSPEEISIRAQIANATDLLYGFALQKSIFVQWDASPQLQAYADKSMINIILRNLISNALKYTPRGGEVKISAKQIDGNLVVSVADNGVGISEEGVSKIFRIDTTFSTFGTENEKGTGLGLVLCKELIDLHRGRIWFESEENKGSRFYFSIPLRGK